MIQSVSIKNLRGIREGALQGLGPLVVLVGPNSSGKSTILDALLIGGGPRPGRSVGYAVQRRAGLQYGARWLFWRGAQTGPIEIEVSSAHAKDRTCTLRWSAEADREVLRNQLVQKQAPGPYSQIDVEIAMPRGTSVSAPSVVFAADNSYSADDDIDPALTLLPVRLVDPRRGHQLSELYSRITERGRRQAVRDLISAIVPGLDALEILTEHGDPRLHLTFKDHSVPVALAGDGVQALVRLGLELAARPDGTILLEEPEAHEHPAAIRQSARAIVEGVRRGIQVIMTTHSLELIDALLSELNDEELGLLTLYRLKLAEGTLHHSRLDGSAVQLSRGDIGDDLR